MPKPADPEHGHALMRLGIGPAEPAIDGVTGAEDRGRLLIRDLVRNQVGGVRIHQHVLGVTAFYIEPRDLQIGTKHLAATSASLRVQLGPYADTQSAANARHDLEANGFKSIVKR